MIDGPVYLKNEPYRLVQSYTLNINLLKVNTTKTVSIIKLNQNYQRGKIVHVEDEFWVLSLQRQATDREERTDYPLTFALNHLRKLIISRRNTIDEHMPIRVV